MKKLALPGFIIALLAFLFALYLQFAVVPTVNSLEKNETNAGRLLYTQALQLQVDGGSTLLFISIFSLLLCSFAAIKKQKIVLSVIGILLSLIGVVVGLLTGTHVFS
jgi:hypothetical protein